MTVLRIYQTNRSFAPDPVARVCVQSKNDKNAIVEIDDKLSWSNPDHIHVEKICNKVSSVMIRFMVIRTRFCLPLECLANTVEPLLSGYPRGKSNWPLNRGSLVTLFRKFTFTFQYKIGIMESIIPCLNDFIGQHFLF